MAVMSNKEISDKNVSSIREDIEVIESMIEEYENCSVSEVDMQVNVTFRERQADALNNILVEREQDKKKIQELEELNQVFFNNYNEQKELKEEQALNIAESIRNDYIPKQKVRDKIKELTNIKGDFATYIATSERIKVLQELLEGEK